MKILGPVAGVSMVLFCAQAKPAGEADLPAQNVIANGAQHPRPAPPRQKRFWEFHLGGGAAFLPEGKTGGYSWLGGGVFWTRSPGVIAPILGVSGELESWFGSDAGGTGVALLPYGGIRLPPFFATAVVGANVLAVDRLADDRGLSVLSPRAGARFGVDIYKVQLKLTADAQYRWRFSDPDLPLYRLGGSVGFSSDM